MFLFRKSAHVPWCTASVNGDAHTPWSPDVETPRLRVVRRETRDGRDAEMGVMREVERGVMMWELGVMETIFTLSRNESRRF